MERTKVLTEKNLNPSQVFVETIIFDKRIIKVFKPYVAVFLTNLLHFNNSKERKEWFYYPHEEQQKSICLTIHQIRESKKYLTEIGILSVQSQKGLPPKEHYRINYNGLSEYLNK